MRHVPVPRSAVAGSRWLLTLWVLLGVGGCGAGTEVEPLPEALETGRAELDGDYRVDANGLSTNGLSTNGLSTNGFSSWFNQNEALADLVMKYVVRCAVPAGQTRTFTSTVTGVTYTWAGSLGLAPGWTSGQPATQLEQEVVSACLAAHANKYGVHVPISVLGRDAPGSPIPYTDSELVTYREKEACFFGNLFDGSGLFAAGEQELSHRESSARTCGMLSGASTSGCLPIVHVGSCSSRCERANDSSDSRPYYMRCAYDGRTYRRPITTRLRPEDIYSCGDGTCQLTERCGNGTTYDNCQADCGLCPPN